MISPVKPTLFENGTIRWEAQRWQNKQICIQKLLCGLSSHHARDAWISASLVCFFSFHICSTRFRLVEKWSSLAVNILPRNAIGTAWQLIKKKTAEHLFYDSLWLLCRCFIFIIKVFPVFKELRNHQFAMKFTLSILPNHTLQHNACLHHNSQIFIVPKHGSCSKMCKEMTRKQNARLMPFWNAFLSSSMYALCIVASHAFSTLSS